MTDRPNAPVTPHLVVSDGIAAMEFYKKAFGAQELVRLMAPGTNKLLHGCLSINGGIVMLADDFPEMCGGRSTTPQALGGSPVAIHLNVPDIDASWAQAIAAGATAEMPPADMFWGDRYGRLRDPFGHGWSLATHIRDVSPAEMQAAAEACMSQAQK
jgi:PhnB protein